MNNVFSVAWRRPCMGIRSSPSPQAAPLALLQMIWPDGRNFATRSMSSLQNISNPFQNILSPTKPTGIFQSCHSRRISFPSRTFSSSATFAARAPRSPPPLKRREDGARFRARDLSALELYQIFGSESQISVPLGNRMLRILQARRISGTIDVDLPADIKNVVAEDTIIAGLEWLRKRYPVDEDAAILKRIEREEIAEEQKLIKRGQALGLYKPQSGKFDKPIEKEGDVYGKSILQETREANERKNKLDDERRRREWLEGEAKDREKLKRSIQKNMELRKFEEAAVMEAKPRADPDVRPALAWVQKHHLRATAKDLDTSKLSKASRILPSLCITLLTIGLCCVLAENYEPAPRQERLMPNTPPAAATVIGLIGANVLIFAMWRAVPPAWRMLNRYFISVPLYPYSISIVGSIFSHQQFRHLGANMLILWFIGTRLHEELGRADFLSLYFSAGVIASLTSLTAHVLQNKLTVTSLGASGAIAGLVAAWCMIHANDKLTIALLPQSWQETFSAKGSTFLSVIVFIEIASLVVLPFRLRMPVMDHWSHLGGYAAGTVAGWWWKGKKEEEKRRKKEKEGLWGWFSGGK
ncbi:rhomboid family protein [Blastomyces gilchristii SLH14081]|uniref:Rhomboid family protein n=1 Tax=Blastomyces gilchristii (strain SLH14081) TaxID=559298 RepID=A0A179UJ49_BLAGS|nr:rhomboid family protein [Blastomyces gilchristii SLH14081]OAT07900.1 rhomboid family protein [Blastomyces gilchristii SLH14081]